MHYRLLKFIFSLINASNAVSLFCRPLLRLHLHSSTAGSSTAPILPSKYIAISNYYLPSLVLEKLKTICFYRLFFFPFCREDEALAETAFHKLADSTLDTFYDVIEQYLDSLDLDNDDMDIEYSQGVLTVKLGGDLGTYVINKQTPNRQIWMSSPVSGPIRYDYHKGSWVYSRDGHKLHERVEKELEELTGVGIPGLNPCTSCGKMNACVEGNYCQK